MQHICALALAGVHDKATVHITCNSAYFF